MWSQGISCESTTFCVDVRCEASSPRHCEQTYQLIPWNHICWSCLKNEWSTFSYGGRFIFLRTNKTHKFTCYDFNENNNKTQIVPLNIEMLGCIRRRVGSLYAIDFLPTFPILRHRSLNYGVHLENLSRYGDTNHCQLLTNITHMAIILC